MLRRLVAGDSTARWRRMSAQLHSYASVNMIFKSRNTTFLRPIGSRKTGGTQTRKAARVLGHAVVHCIYQARAGGRSIVGSDYLG